MKNNYEKNSLKQDRCLLLNCNWTDDNTIMTNNLKMKKFSCIFIISLSNMSIYAYSICRNLCY